MDVGSRPVVCGLNMFGTVALFLTLLVMVVEVPTLHHHDSRETALYDQECPAMRLAAGTGSLGFGSQPLTDLGAVPPAPHAVPSPLLPGSLGIAARPTDVRAPPFSA